MTTRTDIAQILTVLRAAFPRQIITSDQFKSMIAVWHDLLADVPVELLRLAVKQHCAESKWFASVAEIRQAALDLVATDKDRMTSEQAWEEVCRAFSNGGHWRPPEWSHPNIGRAVQAVGGWRNLCLSVNQAADRARFMQAFDTYQRRTQLDRRMLPEVRRHVARYRQLEPEPLLPGLPEDIDRIIDEIGALVNSMTAPRKAPRAESPPMPASTTMAGRATGTS